MKAIIVLLTLFVLSGCMTSGQSIELAERLSQHYVKLRAEVVEEAMTEVKKELPNELAKMGLSTPVIEHVAETHEKEGSFPIQETGVGAVLLALIGREGRRSYKEKKAAKSAAPAAVS